MGDAYKGEYSNHRIGKPVTQYTLEGKKLKVYPTIEEAARATGLTAANIQKNTSGSNKTAGGYIWKFSQAQEVKKLEAVPKSYKDRKSIAGTEVIQYSIDGNRLRVYCAISEAAKSCGLHASNISFALNKTDRTAGNYVWRTKGNIYRGALAKMPRANQAKPVTQYNMKGHKIRTYESARQAEKITGISSGTISFVARGKLKSTGGYIWLYDSTVNKIDVDKHYSDTAKNIIRNSKAVGMYSLEGKLLKLYPSIRVAAKKEGINANRISSVINGHSKSAGGFLWRLN